MAFFGLTQLGYQDTIREHVKEPKTTPISAFRSGSYRDAEYRLPKPDQCDYPPSNELPGTRVDPTARYERGHCGSQQKLDHNKTAGIMCPKGMHQNNSFCRYVVADWLQQWVGGLWLHVRPQPFHTVPCIFIQLSLLLGHG